MAEVLEIQIQDKAGAGGAAAGGGPPRPPSLNEVSPVAPKGPAGGIKAPSAGGDTKAGGNVGDGKWMLEEYSKSIQKAHEGWDKVTDKAREGFDRIAQSVTQNFGTKETLRAPSAGRGPVQGPRAGTGTPQQPRAGQTPSQGPRAGTGTPSAPSAVAGQAPAPPTAGTGSVAAESVGGAAEGIGEAEAIGGVAEALGGLEVVTGGLATAFVAAGVAVGVVAVAAVESFKLGMHLATDEVRLFGLKLSSATDQLAAFSGPLAQAQVMKDVRSLMDDIREANQVGPDLARLVDAQSQAQSELREIWLPIKKAITEVMASVLEHLIPYLQATRVVLSPEFWQGMLEQGVYLVSQAIAGQLDQSKISQSLQIIRAEVQHILHQMEKEKPTLDEFLKQFYHQQTEAIDNAPRPRGDFRPNIPVVAGI